WTAHNMGPDSLMLARSGRGHYTADANIGVSTWQGDSWRRGGAPVWGWISYDAQLDLIYFGTGNPGPYNTEQRPGENKWTNSVLARRPRDGALVWAYQFTPHDSWDYDSNAEMILVDLVVGGRLRKVLVHFDKNGFAYTIDRRSGELLVAEPFANVTWAKHINRSTGLPVLDTSKTTGASRGDVKGICPSLEGGKSPASPSSYSPRTGRSYTPTNNLCMTFAAAPVTRIPGTPYIGATTPYFAGPAATWASSSRGTRRAGVKSGASRRSFRSGAAVSSPEATSCSTGRSTAGSRPPTRAPAKRSGSSKSAPVLWARPSRFADPTASSTSPSTPASGATGFCSPATCAPTIPPTSGRPPISRPTSHATRAREAWSGSSACRTVRRAWCVVRMKPCVVRGASCVVLALVAACERSNAGGVPMSVRYPDHVAAGGSQPPSVEVKN